MIYLNDKKASTQEFETLLSRTKESVKKHLEKVEEPSKISSAAFEQIVYDISVESAKGTSFEGKLRKTSDREFPDIVDDEFFGVEVKATKNDHWTSIGNSVLESSRVLNIEKIYVFFGKLGGEPDVEVRNYEECLQGIAVTHYPRYKINMRLTEGQSIFDKMDMPYETLRNESNPVKPIRAYYQSQLQEGEALWWIDDNLDDSTAPSPIIKSYSSLNRDKKDRIVAEAMVMFPEIFSSSPKKYQSLASYLAASHGVVSPSLRDEFSAGGVFEIEVEGKTLIYPHVVGEMIRLSGLIKDILSEQNEESLSNFWQEKIDSYADPLQSWLDEVDRRSDITHQIKLSELFMSKQ